MIERPITPEAVVAYLSIEPTYDELVENFQALADLRADEFLEAQETVARLTEALRAADIAIEHAARRNGFRGRVGTAKVAAYRRLAAAVEEGSSAA